MDADCASKLACFGGECKNPCFETKPCGKNAQCLVVDSLPLRTMSCLCLPGFVGDADIECKLGKTLFFITNFCFLNCFYDMFRMLLIILMLQETHIYPFHFINIINNSNTLDLTYLRRNFLWCKSCICMVPFLKTSLPFSLCTDQTIKCTLLLSLRVHT